MPRLILTRLSERICEVELGDMPQGGDEFKLTVLENTFYSLALEESEPGLSYAVWAGDMTLEISNNDSNSETSHLGLNRGLNTYWGDGRYFSDSRGRVALRVKSRDQDDVDGEWQERLVLQVYVVASKTTENAFETMCEELRRLASGLLFDLVSKATTSIGESNTQRTPVWNSSSQLELRMLEKLWDRFGESLSHILTSPWTNLTRTNRFRLAYGNEKLDQRSLIGLVSAGIDPRRAEVPKPFRIERSVLEESTDTLEHQVIAGFLDFLQERVQDCLSNIKFHIEAIVEDREFRTLHSGAGVSLYEAIDLPKIDKLSQAGRRANQLQRRIIRARSAPFLRNIQPRFPFVDSPVFRHVDGYYQLRTLIQQYMSSSLIVLSEGEDERLKSTSRLYEQWVLVQIASALRAAGLTCEAMEGMLSRVRRYRYTLDIDRGARLTFNSSNGWFIVMRYEPWIHPESTALQRKDEVFRGDSGRMSWSPDILLEFCVESPADDSQVPIVEYAIVVDAKYSKRILDKQRASVLKYHSIRSTATRKQIVRQVWIAAPCQDENSDISFWDGTVSWTEDGPNCGKDELIGGTLAVVPDLEASSVDEERWLSQPHDSVVRFVSGLLRYMGIACSPDVGK